MRGVSRRSFLKGLVASTVLAPMVAQVAPSPFMVSMPAVDPLVGEWGKVGGGLRFTEGDPDGLTLTSKMIKDLVRKLKRENRYPDDLTLTVSEPTLPQGEVGRLWGSRVVNGYDGPRLNVDDILGEYGYVSCKVAFGGSLLVPDNPLLDPARRDWDGSKRTWDVALEAIPFDPNTVEKNRGIKIS